MFGPVTVEIRNSHAACRAIEYEVVDKKQRFKLARAVIERKEPVYVNKIIELDQRGKIDLSPTWRRYAIDVILKVGKWNDYMNCLTALPASERYAFRRKDLLERLVKEPYEHWKPMKKGTEYDCNLTRFWSQKFLPAEVALITEKVIESGSWTFAESWLYLSGKYSSNAPLSSEIISKLEAQSEGIPT